MKKVASRTLARVEKRAIEKVVRTLEAVNGVKFKVIAPDGSVFGNLNSEHPTIRYDRGITRWLCEVYKVDEMKVGDVVVVPRAEMKKRGYEMKSIRSTLTSFANSRWGKGTYTTSTNKDSFELLRIG